MNRPSEFSKGYDRSMGACCGVVTCGMFVLGLLFLLFVGCTLR